MVLTRIPHFREVMVCSFECPHCGNRRAHPPCSCAAGLHVQARCAEGPCIHGRNNELQFAGTYGEKGVRYTLSLPAGDMDARSRQV